MLSSRIFDIVLGSALMLLILAVSLPLTIITFQNSGGPWGFGIIGLSVLIPLNFYFIFSIAAFVNNSQRQRQIFVVGHFITVGIGFVTFIIFQIVPVQLLLCAIVLALIGIFDKKRMSMYLRLMNALAIVANILLLKWELDFGRSIPIIELFQSANAVEF
ncbi:MAG TPA: hypothetical protein VFU05_17480 [Cyclobacteriaceae bacterium]|nr:hypothetical protein [Cyclobacteriaceae bacterium]